MPSRFQRASLYLMLAPYAVGILIFVIVPGIMSFGLAFFRYDGLSDPQWVGTLNFVLVFTDELFSLSIQNTLALVIIPVPVRVLGAFALARLLQRGGRCLGCFRGAVFLPSVIPTVAFALAWLWLLNPLYGPVNRLVQVLGVAAPAWFADPLWAKPSIALMFLWLIGEGFLVSLAALHDTPTDIEDAARVDGAGSWSYFRRIALPMLAPILLLLSLRDAILIVQESFAAIMMTTGGGPYYATYTLPLFVYEQGFDLLAFGVAGAALWVLYALTGLVVIVLYTIARQWQIGATDETFVL